MSLDRFRRFGKKSTKHTGKGVAEAAQRNEGLRVIIYMGTKCKTGTTDKVLDVIKRFTKNVYRVCWTNDPDLIDLPIDYISPSRWNVIKGRWDIAIGHSAGGFPLTKTNARLKIGINPPYPVFKNIKIMRAMNDWLVKKRVQDRVKNDNVFYYRGGHSSVDKKLLYDIIASTFQEETEQAKSKPRAKRGGASTRSK